MPALWALKAAFDHLIHHHKEYNDIEQRLTKQLLSGLMSLSNVSVYNPDKSRISTLCFNVNGMRSDKVVKALDKEAICVRGGIHCAILAHQTLNTVETGAVRAGMDYNNTPEDVSRFIDCIGRLR
jgi:selenocysteine lyase/cysteine desulfurase